MKKNDDSLPILLSHGQFKDDLREFTHETKIGRWTLLLIDFDLFKDINDTYGHEAGDEVLSKGAHALASAAVGDGSVYRRGGDEMAVILPNFNAEGASVIAEKIRTSIEELRFEQCAEKMTVSIGVASYPQAVKDRGRMFLVADTMMYRAKDYGGNCICIAPPEGEPGEMILPEGKRYMRGDITSRVEAVELWMSINQFNGRHFDIIVKNDNDEEVTIEAVSLRYGSLYLCNFAQPKESTVIGPRSSARIQGDFAFGPVDTLRSKLGFNFSDGQMYEFDIVARGRVLGRVRIFSHTILATISSNGFMSQFSPQ